MKGGIGTILYFIFRLAPIILLVFFAINFFYNYDSLIVLYFVGVSLATLITIIFSKYFPTITFAEKETNPTETEDDKKKRILKEYKNITALKKMCSFYFFKNGPISTLPLSQLILSFTFFYIGYILLKYGLINQNLPILILLPILIVGDITWNSVSGCGNFGSTGMSLVLGTGLGIFWAYIVDSTSKKDMSKFIQLDRKKENCTIINNKYVCI